MADPDNRNDIPTQDETRAAIAEDERLQADPELALSSGKASRAQIWTIAIGALAVIAIVLYGVAQLPTDDRQAAEPPAAQTTGSGSQ
jgi:hypothetical protein